MKGVIEYRKKMDGFTDVGETVKAAEKIAASYIRFLSNDFTSLEKYSEAISFTMRRLLQYEAGNHPFISGHSGGKNALIILTSDKGLVGDLFHNIVEKFLEEKAGYSFLITVGEKGKSLISESNIAIAKSFPGIPEEVNPEMVNGITDYVFSQFESEIFRKVDMLYPEFTSLTVQTPKIISFLPFDFKPQELADGSGENWSLGFPIFEPSKREIFTILLKKYIQVAFYRIIIEAKLSELSSRTVTMEHALSQTESMIKKLKLSYFKERRTIATQKQLESFSVHKTI